MTEGLRDVDRWTAAQCRLSRRLFELCGEHGTAAASPEVAVVLTSFAGAFAWHAELYFDLLPVRTGVDREALVAHAVPGADGALDELATALARDEPLGVAVLALVVKRLDAGAAEASDRVVRELDGARWRALRRISRDLDDLRSESADLARSTSVGCSPDDVARVSTEIEHHLAAAGAGIGLCAGPRTA